MQPKRIITPYEPIFPGVSNFGDQKISQNYEEMQRLRTKALRAPLVHGLRFTLSLKIPAQNPTSGSRPIPSLPTTGPVTLELIQALQSGVDNNSQVWKARVVEVPETVLVLKIVQHSMCYNPCLSDFSWTDFRYPPDLAPDEAWAYTTLAAFQGLYIPYFFGCPTITTPSKESADVLVLEYIPGPTLTSFFEGKAMDDDTCNSLAAGLETVAAVVKAGLLVPELAGDNFIVTGPPKKRVVVAIDLAGAPLVKTESLALMMQQCHLFSLFAETFGDSDESMELLYKWAKGNLSKDLRKTLVELDHVPRKSVL
ncbi:hypothetical protein B0H15DRAFT_894003 [Mycena belliarum]|uniref:Uncharacterized protein n=1 Tax=Mycena belliarum TaxID=1033014 RepID=A0AAD6TRN8_9AGAR|nr:hypothetical protein B0H15DRAFT_894003 [Mycena belliae]